MFSKSEQFKILINTLYIYSMKISKSDSKYLQPEWLDKRKEILLRDGYKCFLCKATSHLQVILSKRQRDLGLSKYCFNNSL